VLLGVNKANGLPHRAAETGHPRQGGGRTRGTLFRFETSCLESRKARAAPKLRDFAVPRGMRTTSGVIGDVFAPPLVIELKKAGEGADTLAGN